MVIKKETSGEPSKTSSSNKATEEKSKTGLVAQELEQRSQEVEEAEDEDVVELSSSSDDSQKKDEETQEIPDGQEKEGSADTVKTVDNNNSITWTDHYYHPPTVFIAVNTSNLLKCIQTLLKSTI